ncbi:MAG TPA: SDR family NAD(P)-dependent oxidoreductase [Thermoanaerobaculia bacterium]|nr:SDR family NAD(P)-dependent oxidoreductase [Thermoanaerobaculia bacterium]
MQPATPDAQRTVLVTGTTSGIGRETARQLARMGARVVMGVRDVERGKAIATRIQNDGGIAEVLPIDLASFASVREAAARFLDTHPSLDVLVNNAGVALRNRQVSVDGHELTWETNFLGGYLLTRLLLPALRRGDRPRVVHVSSEAHRTGRIDWDDLELSRGYGGFRAYSNTKLAQILFTRELARREPGIAANALHPGALATRIWREVPLIPLRVMILSVLWLGGTGMPSAARGAKPVVRLAWDPELEGVTGRYFKRFRETTPSEAALDDAAAARLWAIAGRETGLAA